MLELLSWGIFGALAVKDSIETSSFNKKMKEKAKEMGYNFYTGDRGKTYYMKTDEQVDVRTNYHVWDPKTQRHRARRYMVNTRTKKFVDWIGNFYDPRW